ncbi:MAG: hypothetical protein IH624_08395 [Phycisphaerae bacterium]|nr:hypothetical protein [Phycisphaerae bacterium]
MFFYADGQEILKGDTVALAWRELGVIYGTVQDVFAPGTEGSRDYNCWETGGVLIEESEPKKAFGLLLEVPEDGRLDEGYKLFNRRE